MSPDWAAKPTSVPYAEFGDPQSLNLYSYVRNSPIVRVDADGHSINDLDNVGFDSGFDASGNPIAGGCEEVCTAADAPQQQQPPPQINRTTYDVTGATADDAFSNAHSDCPGGDQGCTRWNYHYDGFTPETSATSSGNGF